MIDHLDALHPQLLEIVHTAQALESLHPDFALHIVLCYTKSKNVDSNPLVIDSDAPPISPTTEKPRPIELPSVIDLPLLSASNTTLEVLGSRPDLAAVMRSLVETAKDGGGVGIGACGPGPLVEQVENLARKFDKGEKKRVGGIEVHVERFSL